MRGEIGDQLEAIVRKLECLIDDLQVKARLPGSRIHDHWPRCRSLSTGAGAGSHVMHDDTQVWQTATSVGKLKTPPGKQVNRQ